MKLMTKCAGWLGLVCCATSVHAATRVYFDKDEYIVSAVDETFDAQILIDADDRTPELEPVRGGLFSFGTEVTFDPSKAELSGPTDVKTTAELDNFGFFAGAYTEVAPGRAGGKGNIDQIQNPLIPYDGSLLMTVTITNKSPAVDVYPLEVGFFRTLGANEQLFLNGSGTVLDNNIVFDNALVRVIPEPTAAVSLVAGMSLMVWSFRKRRAIDARR
jgi:hypothetical protein